MIDRYQCERFIIRLLFAYITLQVAETQLNSSVFSNSVRKHLQEKGVEGECGKSKVRVLRREGVTPEVEAKNNGNLNEIVGSFE